MVQPILPPLECPYTFSDEFSRPINYIRAFMEQLGYDFWCKYPASTGPEIQDRGAEKILVQEKDELGYRVKIDPPIVRQGAFVAGEKGRYIHFDDLKQSYNRITYIGRNPQFGTDGAKSPFHYMDITFARLGENLTINQIPTNGNPPSTIEEFINSLGFNLIAKELSSDIDPDNAYEYYKGQNTDGNQIWISLSNFE
jgi:hypothetical protein